MLFKTWSYFFSCLTHFEPDRKEYSTITKKNKKKRDFPSLHCFKHMEVEMRSQHDLNIAPEYTGYKLKAHYLLWSQKN